MVIGLAVKMNRRMPSTATEPCGPSSGRPRLRGLDFEGPSGFGEFRAGFRNTGSSERSTPQAVHVAWTNVPPAGLRLRSQLQVHFGAWERATERAGSPGFPGGQCRQKRGHVETSQRRGRVPSRSRQPAPDDVYWPHVLLDQPCPICQMMPGPVACVCRCTKEKQWSVNMWSGTVAIIGRSLVYVLTRRGRLNPYGQLLDGEELVSTLVSLV